MKLEFKINENKYFNVKEVLKEYFEISDRLLVKLKKNQKIQLNGKNVYVTKTVSIGDIVSVDLDYEEENENIVSKEMNLNIIYEDDAFLIVNKDSRNSSTSFYVTF